MHTCKTGLNKGYKMQSICICNCSYLNFKILIILVLTRSKKVDQLVVKMVQQGGVKMTCVICPDMNISVHYLKLSGCH